MATKRAPICPALSLPDGIEKAERIYSVVGKNTFSGEVAVRHMGYNGLNGASRRSLGALRSYGLIEGRGANLAVSQDAVIIIADVNSPDQGERQSSLLRALRHNQVFRELNVQFGQGSTLPVITSYLQKKFGFKAGAARKTAKYYKDSVAIINWDRVDRGGFYATPDASSSTELIHQKNGDIYASAQPETVSQKGLQGIKEDSFALEDGYATIMWPMKMTPQNFEDFTDWLLLMHRKISRDVIGGTDCCIARSNKQNSQGPVG